MGFLDKRLSCPRCGRDLVRYEARHKWRCKACLGALVGGDDLVTELGDHAARVLDGPADPKRPAIHPCPGCAFPMTPYTVETVELDRCVDDRVVWFDGGEIKKARAAIEVEEPSLFGDTLGFLSQLREQTKAMQAGELTELPRAEPQTIEPGEWEQRSLCPDGRCIGVVPPNGTCSVCGRAA